MGHYRFHLLVSLLVLSFCGSSYGQARQRQRTIVSSEVHADGRVTFRLQAPGARSVALAASFLPEARPLTRDAEAVWSVTAGPLSPDIHEYHFIVDGLNIADPRNPDVKVWRRMSRSVVLVPGQEPMFFEERDVPHGTVRIHRYPSKSLGVTRGLYVYTPPGYETQPETTYPVLYLLHGSGDTELTWTVVGRANVILDNAIAQKRAKPMIVVMPYGHTRSAASSLSRERRHEAFETDLIRDVMPFVQRDYRVRKDAAHTAIVGLSMGGGQSLRVGLGNPARFGWVAAFSASIPSEPELDRLLATPEAINATLKLLWLGCGKRDFLFEANQRLLARLTTDKIKHVARLTDGAHEWRVWRRYLSEILPLLFNTDG